MKLTFLGTGGGRFTTILQSRWTGGLYVDTGSTRLHVDPGPGALVRMKELSLDPTKTDALFISHRHPDHCTDAEIMIIAMTAGKHRPTGMILGSQSALDGVKGESPSISEYLQSKLLSRLVMFPGDKVSVGKIALTAKPAYHSDPSTIGFVIDDGRVKVGYVPDTDYHASLGAEYAECDILVVSVTRPRRSRVPFHMCVDDAKQLLAGARPKRAVLTHFGEKMVRVGPGKEARWLESETGVDVVAARDGETLSF